MGLSNIPWGTYWIRICPSIGRLAPTREGLNTSWSHSGRVPLCSKQQPVPFVTQVLKLPRGSGHWTLQLWVVTLKASINASSTLNSPPVLGTPSSAPGWITTSLTSSLSSGITTHRESWSELLKTGKDRKVALYNILYEYCQTSGSTGWLSTATVTKRGR